MFKIKFLQVCSFSIILASLHSLNLSFPLLSYATCTAIPKFPPSTLLLLHNPRYQIIVYIIWDVISDITKTNYLKVPKIYSLWSMSKKIWVDEVLLKVYIKQKRNLTKIINFFMICANLKKFTWLILSKDNFAVLIVLDTSLYKVLTWPSIMLTILYVYGVN